MVQGITEVMFHLSKGQGLEGLLEQVQSHTAQKGQGWTRTQAWMTQSLGFELLLAASALSPCLSLCTVVYSEWMQQLEPEGLMSSLSCSFHLCRS